MALSVVMPALEMAQETGKVIAWIKQEGDTVRKGEPLLEIETDKAVLEIEAQGDGVLAAVTANVGDVVPVGQTIAWLLGPGETSPPAATASGSPIPVAVAERGVEPRTAREVPPDTSPRMSPKARRLAREQGIDVAALTGSGPAGEILAADVASASRPAATTVAPSVSSIATGVAQDGSRADSPVASGSHPITGGQPEDGRHALSAIGRLMAERTTQSWTTVPHFFVMRDVDATALNATREQIIDRIQASHAVRVTHTDLIVAAVARALRQHPRMNGSWSDGAVKLNSHVNVALAMAVENAVVTAVIADTDRRSVGDIARQRRELAGRARANRLAPPDIAGATFTISNLGMFAVDAFTAIIVPPQAGILAVGAITERVVAVDGLIGVRPMMTVTLSADHRVIDGAGAAAFLNDVVLGIRELGKWL